MAFTKSGGPAKSAGHAFAEGSEGGRNALRPVQCHATALFFDRHGNCFPYSRTHKHAKVRRIVTCFNFGTVRFNDLAIDSSAFPGVIQSWHLILASSQ